MTGAELIALLHDPAVRSEVQLALGLPSEPVARALKELADEVKTLAASQTRAEQAQARIDESIVQLAAAQARTDESVGRLAARVDQLAARVDQLAAAQARTDESVRQLAARVDQLAARVDQLAAAQARTDESIRQLAAAQMRTDESVKALAEEVRKLSIEFYRSRDELRQALGTLSDNVGFGLEELAAIVLPGFLEREEGIQVSRFTRRFVRTEVGEEEIDVFAEGNKQGALVPVVGEVKSRIYTGDVRKFAQKLDRVARSLPERPLGLMFGFVVHPAAVDAARELGVRVLASRPAA